MRSYQFDILKTSGGQSFSGVSDIIGNDKVKDVRKMLRNRFGGVLSLELVSGKDEGISAVRINVPPSIGCPQGKSQH